MIDTRQYALVRTAAPASEPVTLEDAKLYLRVDADTEDDMITDMIVSARMAAEQFLRRALITQTWKLSYDEHLEEQVILSVTPVTSISSITIFDRSGASNLLSSDTYYLNAAKDVLMVDNVIFGHRVEVVFTAGYGNAADVPSPIKHGILNHIAAMYDIRGMESVSMPEITKQVYMPFRQVRL